MVRLTIELSNVDTRKAGLRVPQADVHDAVLVSPSEGFRDGSHVPPEQVALDRSVSSLALHVVAGDQLMVQFPLHPDVSDMPERVTASLVTAPQASPSTITSAPSMLRMQTAVRL